MTYITVDVDLDDFSDEAIKREYEERFGHEHDYEELLILRTIFQAMRTGDKARAHDLMWDYLRDTLGRVA